MTDDANIHGVESAAMMRPTFLYPKMLVGYKFNVYFWKNRITHSK